MVLRPRTLTARRLRRAATQAEAVLWRALRERCPAWKFRRQHPIGNRVADLACPAAKLAIELDGGQHAERLTEDAERSAELGRHGYRVIRFWNNEVLGNTEGVLTEIVRQLQPPHLTPTLSAPRGGEGAKRAATPVRPDAATPPTTLILACGALAREILALIPPAQLPHIRVQCLPATLHNRPERIAPAVREALAEYAGQHEKSFVAYADCGTGGDLDAVLAEAGVARLPGAHCYAFFTGVDAFAERGDADMRSFFLTDFLARSFDALVWEGLGLDRHPELRDAYFGHYERVVYLAQTDDAELTAMARAAADRLGLAFERRFTGYGDLAPAMSALAAGR